MTVQQEDAILAKATDVFGSIKDAKIWMERPALALGWKTPREIVEDGTGRADVDALLERIRFGVYI